MRLPVLFSVLLAAGLSTACGDDAEPDQGELEVELLTLGEGEVTAGPTVKVHVRLRAREGIASAVLSAGSRGVVIEVDQLDENGEASVKIELPEGEQILRLAATTAEGRTADVTEKILVDSTPPVARILSPEADAILLAATFAVRVKITDQVGVAGAMLSIGDQHYPIAGPTLDANGEATVIVTGAAGAAELSLIATDRAGHESGSDVTTVSVDLDVPEAKILAPRDGVAETRRLLFAQLSDASGIAKIEVRVNGGEAHTVSPAGAPTSFTLRQALPLAAGENQVAITVTDRAGRSREQTLAFRYGLVTTAGGAHSGAIADGQLFTWGRYNVGQLGLGGAIGDAESKLAPVQVPAFGAEGTAVVSVAFNQNHSVALRSDGTTWTWGANGDGQLGHGDLVQRTVPAQVTGVEATGLVYVSAGYSHVIALRADGAVVAWGRNAVGQIGVVGDGTANDDQTVPVVVPGLPHDIVEVVGGSEHSLALSADGRVFAWGRNQYGNLGNGSFDPSRHPVAAAVPGLTDIIDLANGRDHVLALRADGTVATWGLGASGQLGYGQPDAGAEQDRATPVTALTFADQPLTDVQAVFANGNTSYAIVGTGAAAQLWGWGQNFSGQLALGATSASEWLARRSVIYTAGETPTYLDQTTSLVSFGAGATHVIARTPTGTIIAWGWNFRGSLGIPTLANAWAQTITLEVAMPPVVDAIVETARAAVSPLAAGLAATFAAR